MARRKLLKTTTTDEFTEIPHIIVQLKLKYGFKTQIKITEDATFDYWYIDIYQL